MKWPYALPNNRRRGSFPRCLLFMGGDRAIVADKLTKLVGLPDVHVEAKDFWMPQGLQLLKINGEWVTNPIEEANVKESIEEAKLGDSIGESRRFLSADRREEVTRWWLAVRERANTPNWDIASTCTIEEKAGLLLVEAKAHDAELKQDGKPRDKHASVGSKANHEQIGCAIDAASAGLDEAVKGWDLSRDSHYQLANRFAWAWKLASMGVPVVLVYLGFLSAKEVSDLGEPFADCADWTRVVLEYSRNIVPERAWGRDLRVGSITIKPLIRVWEQEIPAHM
ncbi:MAG: hypothetical protein LAN84_12495 [Acidobacteriia bacterium]|nr:hypothetical protein [Terriglobia bacterium]